MSDELLIFREALRKRDPDFRKLEEDHHRLKLELNGLTRRKTLTPQEELQKKQVQVEKLHTKDRIEAMVRDYMKQQTGNS